MPAMLDPAASPDSADGGACVGRPSVLPPMAPLFDFPRMQVAMDNDLQLLREFTVSFLAASQDPCAGMRNALAENNAEQLGRLAHTLKGLLGFFYAERAIQAAAGVERAGNSGNPVATAQALVMLEDEMKRLLPALELLVQSLPPS